MENTSFFKDILVLIGVLPIERPTKVKQVKKRMGYPVRYLIHFSKEEKERMHHESEKLMCLID
ncbi:MAG: hypothetical protein A2W90_13715 [Bacteroidetes bacterium GWF2_42_66]|nr:MAG: hypothetical protein A2W92_14430 [Bacteroidetes bacterium GWA2_42_15]OFX97315.1 MAG: hypothetical protein A2W89_00890 [Bacteroidetes bacterium GWE2_42_39]OFY39952.1 MAG: hypothetical protein A2W90_13715 [Bacteroidetes bacterium GWF2_42_66]HBL78139.1 hypothetical protein [Prolixibacteraceae bacterium]HCR91106.1 hypothetical protein [Prolixibacteraceae bacterium]